MNYLIDGHNLIGKMPDIHLGDPDDEAKLVLRLVNWAAVGKNRRVIVVFDGGVPGVNWAGFRNERVKAVFVPQGKSADEWLIRFMYDQVGNDVKGYTVVSSDRAIQKQAENRRILCVKSETFAAEMAREREEWSQPAPQPASGSPARPLLQPHEVDAWLHFFGGEPQLTVRPDQPRPEQAGEPESAETPTTSPPANPAADDLLLSPAEVAEWLTLFGGEPNVVTLPEPSARARVRTDSGNAQTRIIRPTRSAPPVPKDSPLSQDDADLWHTLFG
jgi:predicted RNA-binding protein with PIN domain